MTSRVRIAAACALLSGCSAVVAPTPGEPSLAASSPAPVARVSSLKPRVEPPPVEAPPPAARAEPVRDSLPAPAASEPTEPPVDFELVATAREAFVHAKPNRRSPKLGYLRLGARVKGASEPAPGDDCPGGWYEIAPQGYVCAGPTATLTASTSGAPASGVTDAADLARARPERDDPLPYLYARSKGFAPPLYARLPSAEEQMRVENVPLGRAPRSAPGWEDAASTPLPELLATGRALPTVHGFARGEAGPERTVANSGFALLSTHEHEGRRFGLTTDLKLVPLDRVNRVRPSSFRGIALGGGVSLPVVFVRARHALLYAGSPERGLGILRSLGYREALPVSGRSAFVGGRRYLETQAGDWLADAELVRIEAPKRLPRWAKGTRTWVSVSLSKQTLVAYVGAEPVYATLVSTGAGSTADVDAGTESRATPLGEFLVHTKHVTATMSGDEVGDEFDLGDVPYVQYFSGGVAFHAVYWHDAFGTPKSHGCVNLSPIDARFLFHFSEPAVPRGWHGAFSLREGTLVSISE